LARLSGGATGVLERRIYVWSEMILTAALIAIADPVQNGFVWILKLSECWRL
jgi:hypothetical protein